MMEVVLCQWLWDDEKKKKLKGKKDEKRIRKGRKTEGRQPNILYPPEDIVHDYSLCIYSL